MARGMVVIDVDRCKGCGLCTHVCPSNILALSSDTLNARGYHPVMVTDAEACTAVHLAPRSVLTSSSLSIGAGARRARPWVPERSDRWLYNF